MYTHTHTLPYTLYVFTGAPGHEDGPAPAHFSL